MGRKNRRSGSFRKSGGYRSNGKASPFGAVFAIVALAFFVFQKYWPVILGVAVVITIVAIAVFVIRRKRENDPSETMMENAVDMPIQNTEAMVTQQAPAYSAKASLMTACEKEFFETITNVVGTNYRVQPQINLASVVSKETQSRYQNELFRNIDFGIFDKNYSLLLLIEINDQTHTQKNRIDRDNKVKAICDEAGIPLVTFWTKYGVNEQYIRNRLQQYLPTIETVTDEEKPYPSVNTD